MDNVNKNSSRRAMQSPGANSDSNEWEDNHNKYPQFKAAFQFNQSDTKSDDKDGEQGHVGFSSFDSQRKRKFEPESSSLQNNPKVQRMMSKMAYKGKGLGKHEQGVRVPVKAAQQKGRRGLGFTFVELDEAVKHYNPEDEIVQVEEEFTWIPRNQEHMPIHAQQLSMAFGKRNLNIDHETNFCDPNILKGILNSKSVFDRLDKNEMRKARTRSNPFETLRSGFFQNRAALKMANIDKMCDFIFTNPANLKDNEPLYFADVCAGPGGFSEYVLWRKKLQCKGFGFTLKRSNDFKLDDFKAGPKENFHTYYGPFDEIDKQGDIFLSENQIELRNLIMRQTNNLGVHFMMSDGGFSVEGQENIQEILSKQLYLCQCLVALMIVREGGHFVTKLFDIFTPFSAGLVYLMYQAFDSVAIIKPNTSRPANSERYLVCRGKLPFTKTKYIEEYLFQANRILLKNDPEKDVVSLVPLSTLKENEYFFEYLTNSNNELGKRQITNLVKIAYYAENNSLSEEQRQAIMRDQCLEHWKIPLKVRRMDFKSKTLNDFLRFYRQLDVFVNQNNKNPLQLNQESLGLLKFPYSFFYSILQYDPDNTPVEHAPTLYLGLGGTKVYRRDRCKWTNVEDIVLPAGTVVYAELVMEYYKEGGKQTKTKALHVIDAYMIAGELINSLPMRERSNKIREMCHVLWGVTRKERQISVRAKPLFELRRDIEKQFHLRTVSIKGRSQSRYGYVMPRDELVNEKDHESPYFFVPGSVMFFKFTSDPFTRNLSRKAIMFYYYDGRPNGAIFEYEMQDRRDHLAGFEECNQSRVLWPWFRENGLSFDGFNRNILIPSLQI